MPWILQRLIWHDVDYIWGIKYVSYNYDMRLEETDGMQ